jgi:hypothetical protein
MWLDRGSQSRRKVATRLDGPLSSSTPGEENRAEMRRPAVVHTTSATRISPASARPHRRAASATASSSTPLSPRLASPPAMPTRRASAEGRASTRDSDCSTATAKSSAADAVENTAITPSSGLVTVAPPCRSTASRIAPNCRRNTASASSGPRRGTSDGATIRWAHTTVTVSASIDTLRSPPGRPHSTLGPGSTRARGRRRGAMGSLWRDYPALDTTECQNSSAGSACP